MLVVVVVVFGEMDRFTSLQIVQKIYLTCVKVIGNVSFDNFTFIFLVDYIIYIRHIAIRAMSRA